MYMDILEYHVVPGRWIARFKEHIEYIAYGLLDVHYATGPAKLQ